jgi:hypothetical protein
MRQGSQAKQGHVAPQQEAPNWDTHSFVMSSSRGWHRSCAIQVRPFKQNSHAQRVCRGEAPDLQ